MFDLHAVDIGALLPFFAVGFCAQLVDGALGMAFGVITNTLLVSVLGVPPSRASANVHIVEAFTTATSGISHALHGNIDWRIFFRLLIPGIIGGVTGAFLLSNIDGDMIKPFVLAYLVLIGFYLLARGILHKPVIRRPKTIAPIGLVGGFMDAIGGGGWGPIVTSNLLVQGAEPRKVIGTVNAVEFFLTLTVSAAFLLNLGFSIFVGPMLGLLAGGICAAPFGAVLAKRVPMKGLLIMVGTVLIITSGFGLWRVIG